MKKLSFFIGFMGCSILGFSQITLPPLSPLQKIEQRVGLTDITVTYSRPSKKGRTIFDDLVPYNEWWRTGANRNTKIEFSEAVQIDGQEVEAGVYSIITKPKQTEWEILLYTDTDNWDVPDTIEMAKIALKTQASATTLQKMLEVLTITFDNLTDSSFHLGIAWEDTYVALPIDVRTKDVMKKRITQANAENSLGYHLAGYYYLRENIKLSEAKELMETAIYLNPEPDYRNYLQLAHILDKLKDRVGAIEAAKKSLAIAKAINSKFGIKENTALLKNWNAFDH